MVYRNNIPSVWLPHSKISVSHVGMLDKFDSKNSRTLHGSLEDGISPAPYAALANGDVYGPGGPPPALPDPPLELILNVVPGAGGGGYVPLVNSQSAAFGPVAVGTWPTMRGPLTTRPGGFEEFMAEG